eukprot:g4064.t1
MVAVQLGDLLTVKALAPTKAPPPAECSALRSALSLGPQGRPSPASPATKPMEGQQQAALRHMATLFTNLEAVPGMRTISMACCCLLAECLDRLWVFLLCLLPMGVLMGLTTWGYLQEAALVICVAFQIPLSLAYLAHRRLVTRHPELWSVTLAFPSVHTAPG